ncbi:MAG TPA: VanZ family protein [Micromonosporaceae bacterium]
MSSSQSIGRWRLIGSAALTVAVVGLLVTAAPWVKAGMDHADETPGEPPGRHLSGIVPRDVSGPRMSMSNPHFWLGTATGVLLATLVALPFAVLAVWALARWRKAGGATSPWRTSLAEVAIVYGTVPWIWMTMLPGGPAGVAGRVSLIPLRDLRTILGGGPLTALVQIGGNLLVFAALGFFGPLRFRSLASVPRILALAAAGSTTIETLQYVLPLDRVSSVDDVLVNTIGAGLAALASRPLWRPARDKSGDVARDARDNDADGEGGDRRRPFRAHDAASR